MRIHTEVPKPLSSLQNAGLTNAGVNKTEQATEVKKADLKSAGPVDSFGPQTTQASDVRQQQAVEHSLFNEPIQQRPLPPLAHVMANPSVEPISPATIDVPEDVLAEISKANKVLIIGHVPPDGDCVGSALGLVRTLEAMGKEADVCVDDVLPGNLRALDPDGEVERFDALADNEYDLTIVVDVAQKHRVGRAKQALAESKNVVVIDHHNCEITPEELGLADDAKLTTFSDHHAEATTLLVAGVVEHLTAENPVDNAAQVMINEALMAGALTDTGHFSFNGISMNAMKIFKHMLQADDVNNLDTLNEKLFYQLPDACLGLLQDPPKMTGSLLSSDSGWQQRIDGLVAENKAVQETEYGDSMCLTACPKEMIDASVDAAHLFDSEAVHNDVKGALLDDLDENRASYDVAVLLFENERGVSVSARSKEAGPAQALAESLGGGGHPRAGGAFVPEDMTTVVEKIEEWHKQFELQQEVTMRSAGNM